MYISRRGEHIVWVILQLERGGRQYEGHNTPLGYYVLTKAHRAAVSMIVKGCIVARVLPLRCFLFLLPNYIYFYGIMMQ